MTIYAVEDWPRDRFLITDAAGRALPRGVGKKRLKRALRRWMRDHRRSIGSHLRWLRARG